MGHQSETVETESEEKGIMYNLSIDLGAIVAKGSAGGILPGEHTLRRFTRTRTKTKRR